MTFLGNLIMYITSFSPLFIILFLLSIKEINWIVPTFYHPIFACIIVVFLVLCVILMLVILFAVKKLKNKQFLKIKSVKNDNSNLLLYLLNYMIPFLWIPADKFPYIITVMLTVSFVVFVKSDLKRYNFILLLFGYNIYECKVNVNNKEIIWYIISKKIIEDNKTYNVYILDEKASIYLY